MPAEVLDRFVKRALDVIIASSAMVAAHPLFLVVAILELKYHGWPPLFRQARPGKDGKIFHMLKFRSMTNETDHRGVLLPDAERLTPFGSFLRQTSLDELPELINVISGDMSIVGPRPLLVEYLPLYSPRQARRHEVRPGITGWAQVNGRNSLSWEEKFDMDVWYVDHKSLCLDLKIIALTIKKVIQRDGISAPGEATMSRFVGSAQTSLTDQGRDDRRP